MEEHCFLVFSLELAQLAFRNHPWALAFDIAHVSLSWNAKKYCHYCYSTFFILNYEYFAKPLQFYLIKHIDDNTFTYLLSTICITKYKCEAVSLFNSHHLIPSINIFWKRSMELEKYSKWNKTTTLMAGFSYS